MGQIARVVDKNIRDGVFNVSVEDGWGRHFARTFWCHRHVHCDTAADSVDC